MAAATEKFRQQHVELAEAARRLDTSLASDRLAANVADARTHLKTLLSKLMVHLAMEDNSLYPRLKGHTDAAVRETAQKFINEMAGIKPRVEELARKWTESAIRGDPGRFSTETRQALAALGDRMQRENQQLYAMVDRLG